MDGMRSLGVGVVVSGFIFIALAGGSLVNAFAVEEMFYGWGLIAGAAVSLLLFAWK